MDSTTAPTRGEPADLTPGRGTRIGLVLPHFGKESTWERIFGLAPRVEQLGYQSVWVRDHLSYRPHGYEGGGNRFLDPFMTLAGVGMLTRKLILSATIIPYRHPLVVSQLFGSLAATCGDRILPCLAAGNSPRSFAAIGMPLRDRWEACRETAHILRQTWDGDGVDYDGKFYKFQDISLNPKPAPGTPVYYSGSSVQAVKRVVEYCDGWFPGKSPRHVFNKALDVLREAEQANGKRYGVGIIPLVSVGKSREDALRHVNVEGLADEMRRGAWEGTFETADDLAGVLVAGSPSDCAAEIHEFVKQGVDHVILDLRFRMADYEDQLELIATELLPLLPLLKS